MTFDFDSSKQFEKSLVPSYIIDIVQVCRNQPVLLLQPVGVIDKSVIDTDESGCSAKQVVGIDDYA